MIRLRTLGSVELEIDGESVPDLQSKYLALLASLAVPGGSRRRDALTALLWPDLDDRGARHSLSQALYLLRKRLGPDAIETGGSETVRLAEGAVWCDAVALSDALDAGDLETAVDLYAGPFLPCVHVRGAEEFERWVEETGRALEAGYRRALEALAERAEAEGDCDRAAGWWDRLSSHDPYDSRAVLRLMRALEASGRRAEAIERAEAQAGILAAELGAEPDPDVVTLAARLRDHPEGNGVPPALQASPGTMARSSAVAHRPLARIGLTALIALSALVTLTLGGSRRETAEAVTEPELDPRRVFVAPFENRTGEPPLDPLGFMAADWIIQGLAETGLVSVVPGTIELWTPADTAAIDLTPATALAAARETSSGFLVRGAYYRQNGSIVFQASVVDAASGEVRRAVGDVQAAGPEEAVGVLRQRVTGALATLLDRRMQSWSAAVHQPPSFEAYQKYTEGLALFFTDGKEKEAVQTLLEAAAMDSTFVMPFLWATFKVTDYYVNDSLLTVIEQRRERMTPFERAVLDYRIGRHRGDAPAAYEAARRAVEIAPSSEWKYKVASEALTLNRPREALEVLLSTNPRRGWMKDWPAYWGVRLSARHVLGDHQGELADANLFREQFPETDPLMVNRLSATYHEIRALMGLGRPEEAMGKIGEMAGHPRRECIGVRIAFEFRAHGSPTHAQRAFEWARDSYAARAPADREALPPPCLIDYHYLAGDPSEMLRLARRWTESLPRRTAPLGAVGMAAALAGDRGEAGRAEEELVALVRGEHPSAGLVPRACIAAHLGQTERALDLLERAARWGLLWYYQELHAGPCVDPLRGHERFRALMKPKG